MEIDRNHHVICDTKIVLTELYITQVLELPREDSESKLHLKHLATIPKLSELNIYYFQSIVNDKRALIRKLIIVKVYMLM